MMAGDADPLDLLVIGGGVNGAGIARDAAGRGMRVLLCEKGDLGEGTSSRSSKLVHGGLRYLEHYEFRLVREALREREVLLRSAPHIIWPMRFVLPHSPEQRPAWMVRAGLFLYDHLGASWGGQGQTLPGTRRLDLRREPEGRALREEFGTAFEYSDCWVEDSRLVLLNALDAAQRGAEVLVRTEATEARRDGDAWLVTLRGEGAAPRTVRARMLVNAAGPWVDRVLRGVVGQNAAAKRMRLVKGSHLVLRKFWDGPQAYLLQNDDKRVIFLIPYQGSLALLGTTDTPFDQAAETVAVDEAERGYLLRAVNRYVRQARTPDDVVAEFAGVRPLQDSGDENASAVTRDYTFDIDAGEGKPPLLSIYGGKITTFRRLAEHALDKLRPFQPGMGAAWTAAGILPGGDLPDGDFAAFRAGLEARHPWLDQPLAHHYARQYGTRADELLDGMRDAVGLGRHFGGLLWEREADFLRRTEWACRPADVLERRTKHYLFMTPAEQDAFGTWWDRVA